MVGDFDKISHEGSIWTGPRAVLYFILHKSIFIHSVHHGTIFYDKYIASNDKSKCIDDDGSRIFSKQMVIKIYNPKYQKTYYNQYYVLKSDFIKDTRIRRTHSGRKRKAIGFVYLRCSPYRGAQGSSHIRSCLRDSIINDSLRIRREIDKFVLYR